MSKCRVVRNMCMTVLVGMGESEVSVGKRAGVCQQRVSTIIHATLRQLQKADKEFNKKYGGI